MASHHGFLPASKEVILEIQLNKLINDFLFAGVENCRATGVDDAEAQDESRPTIPSHDDSTWNVKTSSWKMDNPSYISFENGNLTENVGNPAHSSCETDVSRAIRATSPSRMLEGSDCMPSIQSAAATLPTLEEVRLDIPEQKSGFCNDDKPQHTNKLKVFRLSRAHSVAGSLFCFAMERREQHGQRKAEERKTKPEKSSIKLTRTGSLPCHSNKLHSEAEIEVKHTCRKPPRPPRSSSAKGPCPLLSRHASADTIFVLHSASRRAQLERRKKHATSSSSNASMWALIFTFCFAMVMIGEGFWSPSSAMLTADASINATATHSHVNPNMTESSLKTTTQNNLRVTSQLEKEMQMREFWISKILDPS